LFLLAAVGLSADGDGDCCPCSFDDGLLGVVLANIGDIIAY